MIEPHERDARTPSRRSHQPGDEIGAPHFDDVRRLVPDDLRDARTVQQKPVGMLGGNLRPLEVIPAGAFLVFDLVGPYEERDAQIERVAAEVLPLLKDLR